MLFRKSRCQCSPDKTNIKFIEKLLVSDSSIIVGRKLLPGIYSIDKDDVQKERNEPGSAKVGFQIDDLKSNSD